MCSFDVKIAELYTTDLCQREVLLAELYLEAEQRVRHLRVPRPRPPAPDPLQHAPLHLHHVVVPLPEEVPQASQYLELLLEIDPAAVLLTIGWRMSEDDGTKCCPAAGSTWCPGWRPPRGWCARSRAPGTP